MVSISLEAIALRLEKLLSVSSDSTNGEIGEKGGGVDLSARIQQAQC